MPSEAEKELLLRVAGELDAAKVRPTWEPLPFGAIVLYGEEAGWSAYDKPDVWIIGEPTHWMPLPTPPARIEDAEEPSHG